MTNWLRRSAERPDAHVSCVDMLVKQIAGACRIWISAAHPLLTRLSFLEHARKRKTALDH